MNRLTNPSPGDTEIKLFRNKLRKMRLVIKMSHSISENYNPFPIPSINRMPKQGILLRAPLNGGYAYE